MSRQQGLVVSFNRGYGFVTLGSDIHDSESPRYFFHGSQVSGNVNALRPGTAISFAIAPSDRSDGKSLAVSVADVNGAPLVFSRPSNVSMDVSAPNRRVGVAERGIKDDATFCFAVDQETGERVFVPMPLIRGQQFEYTLEQTDKGPKAAEITGPMGSPLQRPNNGGSFGGRGGNGGGFRGRGFGGGRGGFFNDQDNFRPQFQQQQQHGFGQPNPNFNGNNNFNTIGRSQFQQQAPHQQGMPNPPYNQMM